MHLHETFTVAIDALRANKLRAALTSLGVIIGSASIVLVVTVALTSKKFVISQIEAVGANLVWVELVKTPDKAQPMSHQLTLQDMEAMRSIPGVAQVAVAEPLRVDDVVTFEDSKVLRQQSRLYLGVGEDLTDRCGPVVGRQDFQYANAGRVGERLEQVRFDLVERLLGTTGEAMRHVTTCRIDGLNKSSTQCRERRLGAQIGHPPTRRRSRPVR